jgi:hypothetical protein
VVQRRSDGKRQRWQSRADFWVRLGDGARGGLKENVKFRVIISGRSAEPEAGELPTDRHTFFLTPIHVLISITLLLSPVRFLCSTPVRCRATHFAELPGVWPWGKGMLLAAWVAAATAASAQVVAWDFAGRAGSEFSVSATTLHGRLNPVAITRGAGVTATPYADSFAASVWDTGSITLAAAHTANEYFAFTVSPIAGYAVSFSTLNATFGRTAVGAPNQFQWQYSLDGFA